MSVLPNVSDNPPGRNLAGHNQADQNHAGRDQNRAEPDSASSTGPIADFDAVAAGPGGDGATQVGPRRDVPPPSTMPAMRSAMPAGAMPDMLIDARLGRRTRGRAAVADLRDGFALWRLAFTLGWLDIKLRYRGSALGPLWLTLSSAAMVGSMGFLYATLFHTSLHDYLPYLAISLILWQAGIGGLAGEACNSFIDAESTIRSMRMPFTVQVIRVVVRNVIVLGHNVVVPLAVFAIFGRWPGVGALMSLPGFALWLVDGAAACFLLGTICARFRDVPPIIGSLLQIAYYLTPVIWKPSQLGRHGWWLPINPFDSLLEVVRAPLLGVAPSLLIWGAALGYSVLLWCAAWWLFKRARSRLAFWV